MLEHKQRDKYLYNSKYTMCRMNNKCSSDHVTNVDSISTIITNHATQARKSLGLVSISFNNHHIVTNIDP